MVQKVSKIQRNSLKLEDNNQLQVQKGTSQ